VRFNAAARSSIERSRRCELDLLRRPAKPVLKSRMGRHERGGAMTRKGCVMLRKMMLAIGSLAAITLLAPDEASARGGFRAGGIGMGGAGFRAASAGGGFRAAAIAPGLRGGTFAGNAWRAGYRPGYRPWRGYPLAAAAVVGAGLAYAAYPHGYGSYVDYFAEPNYGNYPYDYNGNLIPSGGYYGGNYGTGCYLVQQRVPTPYGWVLRPMQVCE
jgi:hypothetical protein